MDTPLEALRPGLESYQSHQPTSTLQGSGLLVPAQQLYCGNENRHQGANKGESLDVAEEGGRHCALGPASDTAEHHRAPPAALKASQQQQQLIIAPIRYDSVFSSRLLTLLSTEALGAFRRSLSATSGAVSLVQSQGKALLRATGRHYSCEEEPHLDRKHRLSCCDLTVSSSREEQEGNEHAHKAPRKRLQLSTGDHAGGKFDDGESDYETPGLVKSQVVISSSVESSTESSVSTTTASSLRDTECPLGSCPEGVSPRQRLTVVLDLDDTLVVSFRKESAPYPIRFGTGAAKHLTCHELQFGPGETIEAPVSGRVIAVERPGLKEFLQQLKGFADIVLFTAGLQSYAAPIVRRIDPSGDLFNWVLYRDSTVDVGGQKNVKDLSVVCEKTGADSLGRTVLLDNNPMAFVPQPENGVPVVPFTGNPTDNELLGCLLPLLKALDAETDIREILAPRFRVREWLKRRGCDPPACSWPGGSLTVRRGTL